MKLYGGKHGKYEGRHSRRRKSRRTFRSVLPLALVMLLAVGLTIGGTLAFMQESTDTVTNTFKAGEITYTLNLEANKPSTAADDNNVTMPTTLTAQSTTSLSVAFTPDKNPTLIGYTFAGWYYDKDCTQAYPADCLGTDYIPITVKYGDSHDSNDDANKVEITLYAKWTPNTYEVVYNGNGATAGSMTNSTHIYDVAKNLTDNAYTRTGFEFLGWSTNSNATTAEYTDEQSVINLTTVNGDKVNLYAVWKQMDFTLSFDTQAADVPNPTSKTVTYELPYGELPTVSRTGYFFDGWALDKEGQNKVTADSIVNTAANHTLYAQWTPITYTVKYASNVDPEAAVSQPTGSTADSTHTYDVSQKLTANGFERIGYTFTGWNTKADGTGASYGNEEVVTNLTSVNGDTVTLYAQWGVKTYVIRYHANGGEGEQMADQVIEYDKLTKLTKNTYTRTDGDYGFGGWARSATGEAEFLDEQQVVNLLESGTLDLYAVWLLNSYTVTFDYNLGWGTPPTKDVLYGEEYGVLPPYLGNQSEKLFIGWYTAAEGGERVYPETIVNRKEDHTLWAHWEDSPANDVIKDLIVHNSADENQDGVSDEINLQFKCSSSFEKFNIPLKNLVPGQTYTLRYTASHDASFGDYITGYKNARYGSYIVEEPTENSGNINNAIATDIIATWNDRIEPDGNNDGSQKATNDAWLQGPWNRTITFTATKSTMYWTWEFGLMEDGILNNYNIYNTSLQPVVPAIMFGNKEIIKPSTYNAKIASQTNSDYGTTFTFDGDGGCETVYYPITGLTAGTTYTITFDHEFSGPLIHDTKNNSNPTYEYGCGIMNATPIKTGDKMANLGTWASGTFVKKTVDGKVDSVTLTFTATGNTAYWVWNMANCSDGTNTTTKVTVTNFSAKHATGSSITYYTSASNAGKAVTLDLMPDEVTEIEFVWSGIDDTNMDAWYPVDEQNPVAGNSYELAFEPMDGYTMSEIITVTVDDTAYEVYTDGRVTGEDGAPAYDPETGILTIPAELLTEETRTVIVCASAVAVDISITTEPEPESETEPETTEEAAASEPSPVEVTLNLTNMTAQGSTTLMAGADYTLVLTPDEGYELPEILRVEIDGILYEVYTDGLEHRVLAEGETELPPMPTFDPATGTLTIPASLLGDATENVTITISAVEIIAEPVKEDASETEPTESIESTDTTEPTETEATEPTEPAEPEPIEPTEPTEPTEVVTPTEITLPPNDEEDDLETDEEVAE